jgi:ABC-2 type transport system permease protein
MLAGLWRAEAIKLFSRTSARLGLLVAAFLAVFAVVVLWWLAGSAVTINGAPISESLASAHNAPGGLRWGMVIRNFYVLRAFILLLAAQSVAGELQARTLREDLLRPVPRWAVLFAKWTALATWIAASLGIAWVLGAAAGAALLGVSGDWANIAAGYLASWACDVGFSTLVLVIALFVQGVAGTVMGAFLYLIFDWFLGWFLWIVAWLAGIDTVRQSLGATAWMLDAVAAVNPWLPSSAFAAWQGATPGTDWDWQSFAALAVVTAVCAVIAERRFARIDVP